MKELETLQQKLHEQALTIIDLKHELNMIRIELTRLAFREKSNEALLVSLERKHDRLFDYIMNKDYNKSIDI